MSRPPHPESTVDIRTNGEFLGVRPGRSAPPEASMGVSSVSFCVNLAHEFRTSLTLIIGPLQQMLTEKTEGKEGALGGDPRRRQEAMLFQARRMLRMVNQLLDLATLEEEPTPLRARRSDLVPFLQALTDAFVPLAASREITLRCYSAVPSLPVYYDAALLEKVFYNLLGNALKYTGAGGKVCVGVEADPEGGRAVVRVRDTGVGIAPAHLPHVFERFYRVGEAAGEQRGSGIGLALAHALVAWHRGTITAESTPGFGSTFTVTLPLGRDHLTEAEIVGDEGHDGGERHEGSEARVTLSERYGYAGLSDGEAGEGDAEKPLGAQASGGDRPRVLVVEDDPGVRAYIRAVLGGGYRVSVAADGAAGLAAAHTVQPDLIVTDWIMPGLDGEAFCVRLKRNPPTADVPVLVLTARPEPERQAAAFAVGVDDYLAKPFDPAVLRARVGHLIERHRHLRSRYSRAVVYPPTGAVLRSEDERFLGGLHAMADAHLADGGFGVAALAGAMGVSRRQLHRRLKALTGQTPGRFLRTRRLELAKQLLGQRTGGIAEVAYAVGFSSASHFTQCFHAFVGQTPTEFMAQYRQGAAS